MLKVFQLVSHLLVMALSVKSFAAAEVGFNAKIYDADSNKTKLLFTYQHTDEKKGDVRTAVNTFKDVDGSIAAVETIEFVKSGAFEKVARYHMSQKQLGGEGDIEVKDGKVNFTYTRDGKKRDNTESLTDDFVVGPSVTAYLQRHWAEIEKGERVRVHLAVADRIETLGFDYYKDREETINGKKAFAIKMKPANFLIAQVVKPLTFFYTADGAFLLEVHGRTQVKQKVDGTWRDLDAVTVYEYPSAVATPAAGNSK